MALMLLSALDSSRIQYCHFTAIVIAGMGLFSDACDLFSMIPIMRLIGRLYYHDQLPSNYRVPPAGESTMIGIALLGIAISQLVFGRLGDQIGRCRMYGVALMLMVLGSIGCGLSLGRTRGGVLLSLGFFRFIVGLGIGGDYPLSATIMSEFANKRTHGAIIAAVFSMQGFGILASASVTMVVCRVFDAATNSFAGHRMPKEANLPWRLILILSAIPASLTYYWCMLIPETARYTALVKLDVVRAAEDMEQVLDVYLNDHVLGNSKYVL